MKIHMKLKSAKLTGHDRIVAKLIKNSAGIPIFSIDYW